MVGSLSRYGQLAPVTACWRDGRVELLDGFKRRLAEANNARRLDLSRAVGRCPAHCAYQAARISRPQIHARRSRCPDRGR